MLNQSKLTFEFKEHRNQKVIFCKFPYDPIQLQMFRNEYPSAKWSRTYRGWYVPDNTLYRNRLGIELPEQGSRYLAKMHATNQAEFRKFRDALQQKMYSKNTIVTYLSEFAQLLILIKAKPVYELTTEQLNAYFLYCIKKLKHSENQLYSRMNAVKSYFSLVCHSTQVFEHVLRPKARVSLPKVLSKTEIQRLFKHCENPKHLLILKMAYGMGLRVSEIINLQVQHINLDRLQLLVLATKGKKDRYVHFPKSIIELYQDYLKTDQPTSWLFEGQFGGKYTARSVQAIFKNTMKKAGIQKTIGIHGLRHSYATHLLEAGTEMAFIQKLMGHNHIKTTEIYAKVSTKILEKVQSPLDTM